MNKKSFVLYTDIYKNIKTLSDVEKGKLLSAIFEYAVDKTEIPLKQATAMAFSFIKDQMDRDSEKWENIVKRNRENIKKRYLPKNTKATTGRTGIPKALDNDNDNDNVIAKPSGLPSLSSIENAWESYSPSYLKEKGISDPHVIEKARAAFLSKAKAVTENSVRKFIDKQCEITPPEDYVDFSEFPTQ